MNPSTQTLSSRQRRHIDARAGIRLEVLSGRLWLTRPQDPLDHFLSAGASIELHENHVLIESDAPADSAGDAARDVARYRLLPLAAAAGSPAPVQGRAPMARRLITTSSRPC